MEVGLRNKNQDSMHISWERVPVAIKACSNIRQSLICQRYRRTAYFVQHLPLHQRSTILDPALCRSQAQPSANLALSLGGQQRYSLALPKCSGPNRTHQMACTSFPASKMEVFLRSQSDTKHCCCFFTGRKVNILPPSLDRGVVCAHHVTSGQPLPRSAQLLSRPPLFLSVPNPLKTRKGGGDDSKQAIRKAVMFAWFMSSVKRDACGAKFLCFIF